MLALFLVNKQVTRLDLNPGRSFLDQVKTIIIDIELFGTVLFIGYNVQILRPNLDPDALEKLGNLA